MSPFQPHGDDQDTPSNRALMKQNKTRKLKGQNKFKIKSLADLNEDEAKEDEDEKELNEDTFELEYYMLLNHKSEITYFKLLKPDVYESFNNSIPTIVTTITKKGWIFLWYENLMDRDISFMCAHVFKPQHNEILHDISF